MFPSPLICLFLTSSQALIVSRIAPPVASKGERAWCADNRAEIAEKRGSRWSKYYVFVKPP
jgi:hypothetical protein